MQMPRRILVIRNDKLGDFMLAWPAFAQLKRTFPEAHIIALVPAYTEPMARLCPAIDEVVLDPGPAAGWRALFLAIRDARADAVVTFFSTARVGAAAWLARIPYRMAPATKAAQIFYNHRVMQRRSLSEKPEWAYNVELAARLGRDFGREPAPVAAPYLSFDPVETDDRRATLCAANGIEVGTRLVMIHPGSGGSANNLSIAQYAALARALSSATPIAFVISAGPGEREKGEALVKALDGCRTILYASATGLGDFARQIACMDLFISGSTGPLHIAGALDVPTAAFYPLRRSATSLRWQTTNSAGKKLAFSPPPGEDRMERVDLDAAAAAITRLLESA